MLYGSARDWDVESDAAVRELRGAGSGIDAGSPYSSGSIVEP